MTTANRLFALKILEAIPPTDLSYEDWMHTGMILKDLGMVEEWERWSSSDPRHKNAECYTKARSFKSPGKGRGMGTLVDIAKRYTDVTQIYRDYPPDGRDAAARTHATISLKDLNRTQILPRFCEQQPSGEILDEYGEPIEIKPTITADKTPQYQLPQPIYKSRAEEMSAFLQALYTPEEAINIQSQSTKDTEGKIRPNGTGENRKVADVLKTLERYGVEAVLDKSFMRDAGAWICINPLEGTRKDDNVASYRYVLVECDQGSIEEQYSLYKALRLPIRTLTYSGSKSLHAVVLIDAKNREEYAERVAILYTICQKNGIRLDTANKNPSRLTRLAGVPRGDAEQALLETFEHQQENVPKACKDFEDWLDWIKNTQDGLPPIESLADVFAKPPQLKPVQIDGILRQGHKLLISGPSKAGKSFLMIELATAIATGSPWLGCYSCQQGRVLYINLELDKESCYDRFLKVSKTQGYNLQTIQQNVDVWNLRGFSETMETLARKIIRRSEDQKYSAIIIDPIYKVITGDENNARDMAMFCNQFDRVATSLGSSVIYCHHHSKGAQGGKKAIDRASGSGVFGRDPDAILDLVQLNVRTTTKEQIIADLVFHHDIPEKEAREDIEGRTAWRMEATLREFKSPPPVDLWFNYPIHEPDTEGNLSGETPDFAYPWEKSKLTPEEAKEAKQDDLAKAFDYLRNKEGTVTVERLGERLKVSDRSIRRRIQDSEFFLFENEVIPKDEASERGLDPNLTTQENQRQKIDRVLFQILEENKRKQGEPMTVAELCERARVAERTVYRKISESKFWTISDGLIQELKTQFS